MCVISLDPAVTQQLDKNLQGRLLLNSGSNVIVFQNDGRLGQRASPRRGRRAGETFHHYHHHLHHHHLHHLHHRHHQHHHHHYHQKTFFPSKIFPYSVYSKLIPKIRRYACTWLIEGN